MNYGKNPFVKKRKIYYLAILFSIIMSASSILLSGCGGGGGGGGSASGSSGYSLSSSASTVSLTGADSYYFKITSSDPNDTSFSANASSTDIEVSNKGLPSGYFSVTSDGTVGNYSVTFTGNNSGASVTVPVTVAAHNYDNTLNINFMPPDIPFITVIINGKPFNLLLDTGANGVMIDQSALTDAGITVNPAINETCSITFGKGSASGYPGTVTIQMGGLTYKNLNVIVATNATGTGFNYPSDFLQGDVGMSLSPYVSFGTSCTTPVITPAPLPTGYNNGFTISMQNLSFGPNGTSSYETGKLTLGLDTSENNNTVPGSAVFFQNDPSFFNSLPVIDSEFGGQASYKNSKNQTVNFYSIFDTGSNFMFWGPNALKYANPGYSYYSCSSGANNYVTGELNMSVSFLNSSSLYTGGNFTTYPLNPNICQINAYKTPLIENDIIYRQNSTPGIETMSMSFMLGNMTGKTFYWQQSSWGLGYY